MEHQPKTEPGLGSTDQRNLEAMSIQELVSVLRTAFLTEDYDRVEHVLVRRYNRLQTEILHLQEKFELEKLTRFQAEEDLKKKEELCERGKRAQNNYETLLKEVKKTSLAERKKNNELVFELRKLKKKCVDDSNVLSEPANKRSKFAEGASSSPVARIRGRDGRIRRNTANREEFGQRQADKADEEVVPGVQEPVVQQNWPGGPIDTSLLTRYADHVARYIWFGQERHQGPKPELRIASLGAKLAGWVDPQLISAFVERWHPETSSFHMPFGEMTITLDDVACLLHLPVRGDFYTPLSVTMEEAATLAAELLGVPYESAYAETSGQRGGYFTQQWLYECYQRQHNIYRRYDCAARAYMLMLVGCTIFTNKSYTRVDAKWLPMFRDLSTCDKYSWGSAALICLYDNLNDASMFTYKAIAGYTTLLQCWIHEYFPSLGRRAESGLNCDESGFPRAMRWIYKQGKMKLPNYRPVMDALTSSDVIWCPFDSHRGSIPFDLVTCYSGYLRGCTVVRYLPERCLRQFGFIQYIPPPPPPQAPAFVDIDTEWVDNHVSVDRILQSTRPSTYAAEATPDYLAWYCLVSHPRVCRPVDGPQGAPPVPKYAPLEDDLILEDVLPVPDDPRLDAIASALER
ncbi:hypothetical protein TSUD_256700 [Trifolium subterraneum]|uniref:Aminotransferase-like plant mobile domain-containing protein n=1 Tax=Trifolium subterraneum TaxID=3900 RepID=A0A2Z6MTL0_TRISU|nr:hypothetical protein TSUD_256700 [Trifolium subterraneum]